MVIDNKFKLGQTVYLKTDKEQNQRIITGLFVRPMGIIYYLSFGASETQHYDIEITSEVNELFKVT